MLICWSTLTLDDNRNYSNFNNKYYFYYLMSINQTILEELDPSKIKTETVT